MAGPGQGPGMLLFRQTLMPDIFWRLEPTSSADADPAWATQRPCANASISRAQFGWMSRSRHMWLEALFLQQRAGPYRILHSCYASDAYT